MPTTSPVLVTGATGRVGQQLVRSLRASDISVRALVLPDDQGTHTLPSGVDVVQGDLTDPTTVQQAVKGVRGAFHLAATMDWGPGANDRLFDANVRATYLLLDALSEASQPIQRVVVASSDEVYPALLAGQPLVENRALAPYSFYGLTKEICESMAEYYHRSCSLPVTVARFSLVAAESEISTPQGWSGRLFFGSGIRALLVGLGRNDAVEVLESNVAQMDGTLVLPRNEAGDPYRFQFCDVRDLVSGLSQLFSESSAIGEVFNLSGPSSFTYDLVVPKLAAKLNAPYQEVRLPGDRFDVRIDISKAQRLVGYAPEYDVLSVIEGLPD